jgi:hypothetical protein
MIPFADRRTPRFPGLRDPSTLVLLGVFTLAAVLVVGYTVEPLLTFRPVDAEVVGAGVAPLKLAGHRARTFDAYQSDIFYRYEVAGVPYMGKQFRRADLESSPLMARLHAEAFTAGGHVQAWYNPSHPDEAVLSRSPNVQLLGLTGFLLAVPWLAALSLRPREAPAQSGSRLIE